jgi:hypothetical protein
MADDMNASYELTADDLAAFAQMHQARSPTARRQRMGCLALGFLALAALPLLILLTTEDPLLETARDIWPLLLGPILFILTVPPYIKWRMRHLSKRLLSEGRSTGFYGNCTMSINEDGIRESKESGESTRRWSAVESLIITADHLFVYTSGVEAFVVPRRAFGSETAFDQFVQYIAEHSEATPRRV